MNKKVPDNLQNADLAFVRPSEDALDEAINRSTQAKLKKGYVHVALIALDQGAGPSVIEATGEHGVIERPLADFLAEHGSLVDFYRAKKALKDSATIVERARNEIGQPYNHGFFEKGPGFYCSQLVSHAFKKEGLFSDEPLSFGPEGTILPHWQQYYEELGRAIPIHDLGSSPNSLLAKDQLQELPHP
ncbi:YiiX/YebB-like N1pC/P60 family cysteine hydrolase [Fructobacillus papyrifericola]|uniref:Hydrolase n=1 Tax=Fructobacillus papyrifericola TaxID=2713172 RepID=A0ABS5QSR0_9LACO|nr:YiiX/YebB-like N1pC/P60 family cysteine hydrolase [Fructobacillus papyrifericola]MBS9336161.1 hydrolase [Fructobacillus papyrifericola]